MCSPYSFVIYFLVWIKLNPGLDLTWMREVINNVCHMQGSINDKYKVKLSEKINLNIYNVP